MRGLEFSPPHQQNSESQRFNIPFEAMAMITLALEPGFMEDVLRSRYPSVSKLLDTRAAWKMHEHTPFPYIESQLLGLVISHNRHYSFQAAKATSGRYVRYFVEAQKKAHVDLISSRHVVKKPTGNLLSRPKTIEFMYAFAHHTPIKQLSMIQPVILADIDQQLLKRKIAPTREKAHFTSG